MCGIAGLFNWGDREVLCRMTDIQAHRGPDDRGVWHTGFPDGEWAGLGSRRLAILDLSSAGHMPMSNPEGTVWITYNGEIYNFPELRSELEGKGYQLLNLDTKIFMPTLNLTYNDKMSMAVSTEVRVPFLDKDLVEWVAWNVPPAWKLKGGEKKYILRKAMSGMLPPEVLRQKKASFAAPVDYWLANDLWEMVDDLLDESRIRRRGLFRPDTVRRWVREQREGSRDWSMQIWQLLTFELWNQAFMDRKPGAP